MLLIRCHVHPGISELIINHPHWAKPSHHSSDSFGVSEADVCDLAGLRASLGLWRAELVTGLFYWSVECFRIHDMEWSTSPINLKQALSRYHVQDVEMLGRLVANAAVGHCDFTAVLRLGDDAGGYRRIAFGGRYRDLAGDELIGFFHDADASLSPAMQVVSRP